VAGFLAGDGSWRIALPGAALLFLLGSCAPLNLDSSLREAYPANDFEHRCHVRSAAFSDEKNGLATDSCARVLATNDGGASWRPLAPGERGLEVPFARLVWLSARQGIAFQNEDRQAYLTNDGGQSWHLSTWRLGLGNGLSFSGQRMWRCVGSGTLLRSNDAGESWTTLDAPHCSTLSFADENAGWLAGSEGLFRTDDGGQTWRPIPPPPTAASDVLLWTRDLGWIQGYEGLFRTTDGGAHWTAVKVRDYNDQPPSVLRQGQRVLLLANAATTIEEGVPVFSPHVSPWGDHGALVIDHLLKWYRNRELVRQAPLIERKRPPSRETVGHGFALNTDQRWAWSTQHLYHSDDGGRSWFLISNDPEAIERLGFVDPRNGIAQAKAGWLRSSDAGRTWRPASGNAWDRYELATAEGRAVASPVACLASSQEGYAELRFGEQGCFGGHEDKLRIEWSQTMATAAIGDDRAQPIDPQRRRETVQSFISAIERREVPLGMEGTNNTFAQIQWSCDGKTDKLAFFSNDMDIARYLKGGILPGSPANKWYLRAFGLRNAGDRALKSLSASSTSQPIPPAR
jgi:photosystem II stability/assembly factor-like uncharacterized protein